MAKLSVTEIFAPLERQLGTLQLSIDDKLMIANKLNQEIYGKNITANPYVYATYFDITTVSGQNNYTLPTDFKSIGFKELGLFVKPTTGEPTQYVSSIIHYETNTELIFKTTPTSVFDYTLKYVPNLDLLIADGQSLIIDDIYLDLASSFVAREYAKFDQNLDQVFALDQDYIIELRKYVDSLPKQNLVYTMPDIW